MQYNKAVKQRIGDKILKQISIDDFEKLIYEVLELNSNGKDGLRYFTLMKKIEDPDDMKGMAVHINYKGGDPSKAIVVSINEDYRLQFQNIDSQLKRADLFCAFYEHCYDKKRVEEARKSVQKACKHLGNWLFYVSQNPAAEDIISKNSDYSLVPFSQEALQRFCGIESNSNKGIYIMPPYDTQHENSVHIGGVYMIANDVVLSKYQCAKTRPYLVLRTLPDQKRALVIPFTTQTTDLHLYGKASLCEFDNSYLFNSEEKTCYLKLGKSMFVGFDQIGTRIGEVNDENKLMEYKNAFMKYWGNLDKEVNLSSNSSLLDNVKTIDNTEIVNAETIDNVETFEEKSVENKSEENVSTFIPLDKKEIAGFYKNGDYNLGYVQINYNDVPLANVLPKIDKKIRQILSNGILQGKKYCFRIANSKQNKNVSFISDQQGKTYSATFNEEQQDAKNYPRMDICIETFRVKIKVNGGYFILNQVLTEELQKTIQQEWKFYYVYLACYIIRSSIKNPKFPSLNIATVVEHIKNLLKDAGLKYNDDLSKLVANPYSFNSLFKPELVECYVDFYEKPDEENE